MKELADIFSNLPGKETTSIIAGFAQDSTVHCSSFSNLFWIILFLYNALIFKGIDSVEGENSNRGCT